MLARNFPGGAILLVDQDLRYVIADGEALARVGWSHDMIEGKRVRELDLPAEVVQQVEQMHRTVLAGEALRFEAPYGKYIYEARAIPLSDGDEIVAAMVVLMDVTEYRQLQQTLAEREAHLRTLSDHLLSAGDGGAGWYFADR